MMKKVLFALILAFFINASKINAQNSIIIYNNSNTVIPFYLSYDNLNWSAPFTLGSQMFSSYPLGGYPCCYISLSTLDQYGRVSTSVNYQLCSPYRYEIYWNNAFSRWDVMQY